MTLEVVAHEAAGGPPWWTKYVDLEVELGIGTTVNKNVVARWSAMPTVNRAHWDRPLTGTWAGTEPIWVAVDPCNLLDVNVNRGRDRWIDRFGASTAAFTAQDPDGNLSWDAADTDDFLEIRPGRELRIRARHVATGVEYPVWRGWVEAIDDAFAPASVPVASFSGQDGYAQLAHIDLPEQSPVGGGELSSARVTRLLDVAGWPVEWRDLDVGRVTVQATNLARPIADDLGITADSEGGAVFADREGRIAFRNRDWLRTDPVATTVQATVGGAAQQVCAASYETTRNAGDIVNDVQLARAGGTMQRFVNTASISRYRQRSYSRSDFICETDAQIALLAQRILNARAGGQVRIPKLTVVPTDDPAEWSFVLGVDYGWRLEVHYPATDGTDWVRTVIVQGVAHKITPDRWECELRVDDAAVTEADTWDGRDGWDRALWSVAI